MILGGAAIADAFRVGGTWQAYRNNEKIYSDDLVIGPNSVDVTLGDTFVSMHSVTTGYIDPSKDVVTWSKCIIEDGDQCVLDPGDFMLASVNERFDCDNPYSQCGMMHKYVQMLEGRSTLARNGLAVHITAGFGDYGFKGAFTLELYNHTKWPMVLTPGMRIAQVYFAEVFMPKLYKGKYSNEDHYKGPVAPATCNV